MLRYASLVVLMLLFSATSTFAQLQDIFTSPDGALSFRIPDGWVVSDQNGQYFLGTDEDAMLNTSGVFTGDAMQLVITLAPVNELGLGETVTAEEGLTFFLQNFNLNPNSPLGNIETSTPSEGRDVALTLGANEDAARIIMTVQPDPSVIIFIAGNAAPEQIQTLLNTAQTLANHIIYAPLRTASEVWRVQRRVGSTLEDFQPFSNLAAADDDTLFAATGFTGIYELSPDGENVRPIPTEAVPNLIDMAPAPDGTLYAVDPLAGQVLHMQRDGTVLARFGEFPTLSPTQIEYHDEALYVLSVDDETQAGFIQRWTLDGEYVDQFPLRLPDENEGFGYFVQFDIANDGRFYVLDALGAVRVFAPDGSVVTPFFVPRLFEFATPNAIAVGEAAIYVATGAGEIWQVDGRGRIWGRYGIRQAPIDDAGRFIEFGENELYAPTGLAVLSDGSLAIADSNFYWAQIVRIRFEPTLGG